VGLAQLVRFIVMELIHSGLNTRFDMGVVFTANYSFSGRRHSRRQRDTLVTDFVNLKRFIVMELTHPGLNTRFDMGVVFTANYSFSGRRCPRRQRDTLGD
jgi:hypothetical protein